MPDEVAAAAQLPEITPTHAAVAGRVRLHVARLRRHGEMRVRLERRLASVPGIHAVSASAITGNVLIRYDPALPLARIVDCVATLMRDDGAAAAGGLADRVSAAAASDAQGAPAWHARSAEAVAADLGTSATTGLDSKEARLRLAAHGRNALPAPLARSGLAILTEQFASLPVALLAVAAGVSLLTGGGILEAMAIATVVGLNGAIGYATESRSEQTIRSLSQVGQTTTHVVRDGKVGEVPVETVVPGDLFVLQRGVVVPADGRIVTASDLTLSEAVLTGESLPVAKTADPLAAGRAVVPLGDRVNMVYRSTVVTGGSGTAVAVGTGPRTEVGHIQRLVGSAETPETPSQRQLRDLGRQLVWLSVSVCGAVFGIGLLRGFGVIQMLRSSISLAVAAVPEGLPMVATTTLALGIEEMRRRDVLIRRLDAIETLAAVQVICFDKTGTLTLNDMAVAAVACADRTFTAHDGKLFDDIGRHVRSASADPCLARLLEIGVLCSDTTIGIDGHGGSELNGTATENAIVRLALDTGIDAASLRTARPRLAVRHRSEAYRFMVTVHPLRDGKDETASSVVLIAVKGSPADVLDRCGWELGPLGKRRALTRKRREAIERANAGMADQALRVLGFACAEAEGPDAAAANGNGTLPEELTWVGLAGLADPVRPGMRELMASFHDAGIRTVLVTGDQSATARTVVRQLGLAEDGEIEIVDAADLDAMAPDRLAEAARRAHAFARVSPAQKLQIVRAFQHAGMVVAMTGDGVNDSPALKAADVGVALGRGGTEAAREVADVVLNTDDLMALVVAVERGRTTYTNIRKAIHYLLSTNLSEILVVLAATSAGVGEALSPMQLLWINLISDVLPGIGLACEPPEPDAMERGPQPAAASIVRREDFGALAREAGLIGGGALAACAFGALRYGAGSAEARTMTFGSLVISQLLHALTCRSSAHGLFDAERPLPPNAVLSGTLAVSFGAQVLALLVPGLRRLLGIVPIGPAGLLVTLAAGVLPYLFNEALKSGDIGRTERIAERRLPAPAPATLG